MILVPVGILANFPPSQVEAVLLHELAHIRRHDYMVNFIQRISELIFFFNPGLLWISALMRNERENCCDDIAILNTSDRLKFVNALISFREHSMKSQTYALGLFKNKNQLFGRVNRIVNGKSRSLSVFELAFFGLNFILLIAIILGNVNQSKNQALVLPITSYMQMVKPVSFPGNNRIQTQKTGNDNDGPEKDNKLIVQTRMESIQSGTILPKEYHSSVIEEYELVENEPEDIHNTRRDVEKFHEQVKEQRRQADAERKIAEIDRKNAEIHRKQAEEYREQAELDRKQAQAHREQAEKERRLAEKYRNQVIRL
jgi:hypothetical protein